MVGWEVLYSKGATVHRSGVSGKEKGEAVRRNSKASGLERWSELHTQ